MTSSSFALPLKQWSWNRPNILAAVAAGAMCVGLLGGVLYCDTSYRALFGTNRCTLFGLFISTFYGDLRDQFMSLFHGTPTGMSIAAEVVETEWTQCLFVPFLVAWMVYWLRPRLRELPVQGTVHGYFVLGAGLLIYLIGYMGENYYVGIMAMQLVYAGLILLFLGWRFMRALFFPWAFLLFMWPYGFFEDIAFELRMLMSGLSHEVLLLIGVPNMLNGTAIVSPPGATPVFGIDIADPCSGIRSLFALVMVATLAAFLLFNQPWKKAVIVIASVPLVILGNLVRIVMLTLATVHFGEKFALGENDHPSWFHEGAGYVVYLVNFACLIGLGWVLNRLSPDRSVAPASARPAREDNSRALPSAAPAISTRINATVLVLAVLTVATCWLIPPASTGDETGVVMDLPDHIDSMIGFYEPVSQAELAILPPDTTFARKSYGTLFNDRIDRILCSIVLSGREKRSIHRPERCLPGQGWSVIGSNIIEVPLESGHPLKVTALLLRRPVAADDGSVRMLQSYYLYWYVGREISTPYSFVRVMLTNWDLVVHRFNQRWAYVIVTKPITASIEPDGMTQEQTLAQLKDFIRSSVPSFVKSEMPAPATASR